MEEFAGLFKVLRVVLGVFFLSSYIAKSESKFMKKIRQWFKNSKIVNLDVKNQEIELWEKLKAFLEFKKYRFGAFEREKTCEVQLEIIESYFKTYYYSIDENELHLRVQLLEEYPVEQATDIFVLASHLNNILRVGKVKINVKYNYVEYHISKNNLLFLLEEKELVAFISSHYSVSQTLFFAYYQLINQGIPPVEIISEIMKANEDE
jgi:hypothetical protein